MKKLILLLSLLALGTLFAAGEVSYRPAPLPGGNFESNLNAWPLTSEYKIGPWGRNGTNGLKCERTSGYDFMGRPMTLKHGSSYRLSWWMKIDGTLPGGGAAVSVDWYAGGRWVSFTMLRVARTTDNEWKQFSGEFTAPPDPALTFALLAYLRHDTVGRVYFDDFVLEEVTGEAAVYPLNASTGRITPATPLEIATYISGDDEFSTMGYTLTGSGQTYQGSVPVKSNRAIIDLAKVKPGQYTLNLAPAIKNNPRKFAFEYPLTVEEKSTARIRIDNLGRCLVDGKPFMPLGWFAGAFSNGEKPEGSDYNLKVIADSPFNTVMPYNGLKLRESKLTDPAEKAREALDACHAIGQMVIFSIKDLYPADKKVGERTAGEQAKYWIENLKDHPALLAWYISDELSKDKIPQLVERRRMINTLDPDHPTWALFCSYADLPYFGSTFDVVGIDPYPINAKGDIGIKTVLNALQDTARAYQRSNGELALWAVPQAFNAAVYTIKPGTDPDKFLADTRPPSEREMLAMSLLEAIGGAKGFIYYSEFDLRKWPENKRYQERWEIACRVGQVMRDLEPFIMASAPRLPIRINAAKNTVKAQAMTSDGGKIAVLIASVLPGPAEAVITGPKLPPGLKSLTGNTVEIAPGQYKFTGKDADCDVLR